MNTQEKLKLINEILEKNDISIQDDYFEDIFKDENNVEIFRVMSSRFLSKYPEKENELLDEIIKNLNNYFELPTTSNGLKIIAYNDRIDEHREQLDEYAEREIAHHFEKGFTSGFLELEIDEIFYDGYWARNTVRLAEPHQKTTNE